MSLQTLISTQDDAGAALTSIDRRHAMSTGALERLRQTVLDDSYLFAKFICGHTLLVRQLHMPLSYVACGLTDKLIECLNAKGFDSYVTRKLRAELWRRNIDWTTPTGRAALDRLLDFVNIRWFRGSYKSSTVTHAATTYLATRNPNITAKITHATDPMAWKFCQQIGATILSGAYQDLFPDRVPESPKTAITQSRIDLAGRTVSRPQGTIQASGYITKDVGGHYDLFVIDDLVMEQNATTEGLRGVHTWLSNLEGYYIEGPDVRVRRIHVGTKWDENDDDTFLTSGANATDCLTVRVPIEEHEGEVVNLLQAGKPTIPQLYPPEKIAAKKRRVLNKQDDDATPNVDGARSWRCNYLLDAYAGGVRLFTESVYNDPLRQWLGPYPHPLSKKHDEYKDRFLVARYARDDEGRVMDTDGKPVDTSTAGWSAKAHVLVYDPWRDLDRVLTLDPSWADGGDNWAVTAAAIDHDGVKFQLETRSGTNGTEGWIEALDEMDRLYRPRVIGFDGGAYQDPVIQKLLKVDPILRRMRSRSTPIRHNNRNKKARIRAGVAEPLKMYRWLLLPPSQDSVNGDFGAQATRDEMKNYRGDPKAIDGILDSLSMVDAVAVRVAKREDEEARPMRRPTIDPILGVPLCA